MIPGLGGLREKLAEANGAVPEKEMARTEAIINSMTMRERRNPDILNGSRRARIAKGAGVTVAQVNQMVRQFEQMRQMMKGMMGGKGAKGGRPAMPKMPRGMPPGMMPPGMGMPGMGGFPGMGGMDGMALPGGRPGGAKSAAAKKRKKKERRSAKRNKETLLKGLFCLCLRQAHPARSLCCLGTLRSARHRPFSVKNKNPH